ncbi:hypothetical protein F5144DRAFT_589910 [Chaetomium tenue]|uniref:Uncharacterized protein n=1 Tax=Chaetomium tenue TaxID=1854479 RepID=A0ACB7PFZ9_9PEZI|nr:hypothetical protein F5144DRAFT_589910 [Chaetomium globosum]
MSDPEQYTVGWICAISTEAVAARAFLDEEYDGPRQVARHDNNSYVLGKIGCHNVVIAALPDGEYGTTSAAALARDMLHSFPNVRIGLMVGIGGGAPSQKRDIRLGDVVVSSRNGGQGGVFQYDFGKTVQNQSFQETGILDQPPMVLRTAVSSLRSTYEMRGHRLVDDVDMALKKIKKRKKYTRPPPSSDRLYKADIAYPLHPADDCDSTCDNDEDCLVVRDARDEEDDDPAIHYRLIASGNQLIKDAHIRDKLADSKSVLCFETEAAGLMNHFPCLVIRGICDYSDSHKNKKWQGFAAMMAAAYAKDLLRQIPSSKVEEERRIGEVLGSIQGDLRRLHQTVTEMETAAMITRLERWLRPPNTSPNFVQARKKSHEGSGQWFLDSTAFNKWKHGDSYRHLWLHGLAGCGKTVLSTTIVDHLRKMKEPKDCVTLEFYFDFSDTTKQEIDGVLRSLVFQLYKLGFHPKDLDRLYKSHFDGQRHRIIYIVLDALDECGERKELLEWMKGFTTRPGLSHVHLIATSRPEEEFLSRIPEWLGKERCLPLDSKAVDADIRSYVTAALKQNADFVDKRLSQDLLERICTKVGDGADGVNRFRWAACQLASLATCMSPRAIEIALETLPRDLYETYHRMLQSIPANIAKDAMRLLQFLVHAKRPLTLREAVEVIATQAGEEPRGFDPNRRLFREADVLRHCPGLVSVIEASSDYGETREVLKLAHFSVKEYLLKQDQFDIKRASTVITKTCLSYLTCIEGSSFDKIEQDFPMTEYAANNWIGYATLAETSGDVVQATAKFFEDQSPCHGWYPFFQKDCEQRTGPGPPKASVLLYYACLAGLPSAASYLLDEGADVNAEGGFFGFPLQASSVQGHNEVVRFLLENGANVHACGGFFANALQAAIIVRLLLDRGADVNSPGGDFDNALHVASFRGHTEIVQLLLDKGAKNTL